MDAAQGEKVKRYRREELDSEEQLPSIAEDEEWVPLARRFGKVAWKLHAYESLLKLVVYCRGEEYVPLKKRRQMEEERRLFLHDRLQVCPLGRFPLICHHLTRPCLALLPSTRFDTDRLGCRPRQPLSSHSQMRWSLHMLILL